MSIEDRIARLDVLDSILSPRIESQFLSNELVDFINLDYRKFCLITLGAIACGVTPPKHWDDYLHQFNEEQGRELIEDFIDHVLKEKRNATQSTT